MKKVVAVLLALFSIFSIQPATSATPVIRIVDIPHTNFDGTFRDNELVGELSPEGKLGKAVFAKNRSATWVIDAALIDEIIDMSDGYLYKEAPDVIGQQVASAWLEQLRIATAGNPIVALPYGNPDSSLARKLSTRDLALYNKSAQSRLEEFFNRPVISQNGWGKGKSRLSSGFQSLYERQQDLLASLTKVVAVEEITTLQLRLGRILNPLLDSRDRAYFSYQGRDATTKVAKKLRIVPGRFQLTSTKVEVPLTLVNDFETATVVSLSLIPMNSRVQVENVNDITIPPKSLIQISVPFTVIASGSTLVLAQFITPEGDRVGQTSRLNLSLTVIDSRVAWFTTGAAIFLFLGAIIQSVRRIRKGRNEKQ
ncbi:MAG: hypothetical protein F2602_05465 [Actinobacteria bacterium]|uniref:Unannotated protein n=1 Tax=freshwater metagenome TaxID=449393 RepID=A0A6J6BGJ4_9ZZZZ|nr:hypothetical protein [Actinomycetota bacterium]MTA20949.1 hypothetical protein [Actinomycetota bacterium]